MFLECSITARAYQDMLSSQLLPSMSILSSRRQDDLIAQQAVKTKEQVATAKELTGWPELELKRCIVLHVTCDLQRVAMSMCAQVIVRGASMVSLHNSLV